MSILFFTSVLSAIAILVVHEKQDKATDERANGAIRLGKYLLLVFICFFCVFVAYMHYCFVRFWISEPYKMFLGIVLITGFVPTAFLFVTLCTNCEPDVARLLKSSKPIETTPLASSPVPETIDALRRAMNIHSPVEVFVHREGNKSPISTAGLLNKPFIILPEDFIVVVEQACGHEPRKSTALVRFLIAHELAHIKHKDFLISRLHALLFGRDRQLGPYPILGSMTNALFIAVIGYALLSGFPYLRPSVNLFFWPAFVFSFTTFAVVSITVLCLRVPIERRADQTALGYAGGDRVVILDEILTEPLGDISALERYLVLLELKRTSVDRRQIPQWRQWLGNKFTKVKMRFPILFLQTHIPRSSLLARLFDPYFVAHFSFGEGVRKRIKSLTTRSSRNGQLSAYFLVLLSWLFGGLLILPELLLIGIHLNQTAVNPLVHRTDLLVNSLPKYYLRRSEFEAGSEYLYMLVLSGTIVTALTLYYCHLFFVEQRSLWYAKQPRTTLALIICIPLFMYYSYYCTVPQIHLKWDLSAPLSFGDTIPGVCGIGAILTIACALAVFRVSRKLNRQKCSQRIE